MLGELRAGVPKLADPVMFPLEVRVAAADDIWLSTAYGRDCAYIAIHQYLGMPYRQFFDLFESITANVGGRPHWGKMHSRDAEALAKLLPEVRRLPGRPGGGRPDGPVHQSLHRAGDRASAMNGTTSGSVLVDQPPTAR